MPNKINHLHIKNFRSLADIHIKPDSLNILFGPNGAGKSTFLDTIWFIRDCAIRGVDSAASFRDHGIGILCDGANTTDNISISIEDESTKYEVVFGLSAGRIEPFVAEKLVKKNNNELLIDRTIGSDKATFYNVGMALVQATITLREPEKLALTNYVAIGTSDVAAFELDKLLRAARSYHLRSASLFNLRRAGSESEAGDRLQDRCENLWSVLRNLHDRRVIDERYDTIINFMKESFPSFDGLYFEQTGRNVVYANFLDTKRRKPIQASGVSDGYIQMLINLTALFSDKPHGYSLILLDEPDISLHPWALAVLAKAVKLATEKWNKQVFISTHSPVLISQFEPENIWVMELDTNGKTMMQRVSEIEEIQDLLEDYATGSLYMAEAIARQSQASTEE